MLGEYCGEEEGQSEQGTARYWVNLTLNSPSFPPGMLVPHPRIQLTLYQIKATGKKKNPVLCMYVLSGFLLLFLLLVYLDEVLLCSPG